MAFAVTAWSPVIMRTSMPAPSAVWTAPLASARSGSMMPTMPTKSRSCVSDIGSEPIASSSSSSTNRAANASTRRPCSPIRSLAASMSDRISSIGTWVSLNGPPARAQRARTTSGPPFTSSTTRSRPASVARWKVAMNLYSESKGTSASRG